MFSRPCTWPGDSSILRYKQSTTEHRGRKCLQDQSRLWGKELLNWFWSSSLRLLDRKGEQGGFCMEVEGTEVWECMLFWEKQNKNIQLKVFWLFKAFKIVNSFQNIFRGLWIIMKWKEIKNEDKGNRVKENKATGEMESVSRNAGCDACHSTEEGTELQLVAPGSTSKKGNSVTRCPVSVRWTS